MSARAHARRGFTLIELMVALGLTAVVAVGLYSLSAVASQTFHQQQRISEIQLRLRTGMEMLRADVQRAGFMVSPNTLSDPMVCPAPATAVQAIQVSRDNPNPTWNPSDNAGISPVRIVLAGNYISTDEYLIEGISGNTVSLQQHSTAYLRVNGQSDLDRIFRGRYVRILGTNGQMQFNQVTSTTYQAATGSTFPTLTLSANPVVIGIGGVGCGIAGVGTGATIAPYGIVQYRIGNVASTEALAYSGAAASTIGKTDLIREEFVPGGARVAGTERIVAEYAVDLDVAMTYDSSTVAVTLEPTLTRVGFGDARVFTILGQAGTSGAAPQRVRSVGLRLSVRDRVQDRDFGWATRATGAPLTRFRLQSTLDGAARVRSAVTEVSLANVMARGLR